MGRKAAGRRIGSDGRERPDAVARGAPILSLKSIEAIVCVQVASARRLYLLADWMPASGDRPRAAAVGGRRSDAPDTAPAVEFDQRLSWWPSPSPLLLTRLRRWAGACLPPARLPARGHLGVGADAKVPLQTCGAAHCLRQSTLDAPYRLPHTRTGAPEMAIHCLS